MTLLPALLGLCGDSIERLRVGPDRRATLGHSALLQRWGERLGRRRGVATISVDRVLLVVCRAGREPQPRAHRPVQRAQVDDRPSGLRPAHRRLRPRRQRPAAGHRRPRQRGRRTAPTTRGSCSCTTTSRPPTACRRSGAPRSRATAPRRSSASSPSRGRRQLTNELVTPCATTVVPAVRRRGARRRLDGAAARPRRPHRRAAAADHRGRRRAEHAAPADRVPLGRSPRCRPRS